MLSVFQVTETHIGLHMNRFTQNAGAGPLFAC